MNPKRASVGKDADARSAGLFSLMSNRVSLGFAPPQRVFDAVERVFAGGQKRSIGPNFILKTFSKFLRIPITNHILL